MTKGKDIHVPLSPRERVRVRGYHEQWHSLLRQHLTNAEKPVVVILGPTASGKTAFSLEVAKWIANSLSHGERARVRGSKNSFYPLSLTLSPREREQRAEIINADSRQLYRYLDIGTAKITEEEKWIDLTPSPQSSPQGGGRMRIPHHLFSVLDPKEKVTVGWYKREAEKVIDGVLARGNIPILVGGSMLYISAVTDGYVFTGRGGKRRAPVPYDLLIFGLRWPRTELVKRIEERARKLLEVCHTERSRSATHGDVSQITSLDYARDDTSHPTTWLSEVAWLLAHGYTASDPGMESCGYREIAAWLLGGKKEESFPSLRESICVATRQYARRQMTWWRNDERIHWINATTCHGEPVEP